MSAPLVGRRVRVTGTSRHDLNGREGMASRFDDANGRYIINLDGGTNAALKYVNTVTLDSFCN